MVRHTTKVNKKKKKDNSTTIIIAVAVIVLAIVAVAVFAKPKTSGNSYETYNGFEFEERNNFWLTYVELDGVPYEAPFNNHPLDVESIFYDESITPFVLSTPHKRFFIAVSDNVGSTPVLAGANIARITGKLYGMPTQSALYVEPEDRDPEQTRFEYRTCDDATSAEPVFWINVNDTDSRIYRDSDNPNCVILGAKDNEGILAVSDLFSYKILQIMR